MQPVGLSNFVLVIKQEVGHMIRHLALRWENLKGFVRIPDQKGGKHNRGIQYKVVSNTKE